MAEEKILNEEVLGDEQLEEVAGGNDAETLNDWNQFVSMADGKYVTPDYKRYVSLKVESAFRQVGKDIGLNISANINKSSSNSYYLDGQKISRDELWSIIK